MLRTATASQNLLQNLEEWDTEPIDDEARLAPRRDSWLRETSIAQPVANYRSHFELVRQIGKSGIARGHGLQATFISALRQSALDTWSPLLLRRFHRWLPAASPAYVRVAVPRIRWACASLPHSVVFDWLRGILNGMPSMARNCQKDLPCIMCGSASDRLEHTVHCPALIQLVGERFPLLHRAPGPVLRWEMLTLSAAVMSDQGIRESVVYIAVVIYIHNAFHHGADVSAYEIGMARLRCLNLHDRRV
jgi:hypothetical protein